MYAPHRPQPKPGITGEEDTQSDLEPVEADEDTDQHEPGRDMRCLLVETYEFERGDNEH